jgi:hypothetical protein
MARVRINLIPRPRMLRKRLRRRVRGWAAALAIHTVALGGVLALVHSTREPIVPPDDSGVRSRITQLTADFAQANQALTDARFKHAAALALTGHPDWSTLLALLGARLGDEVVVRDVKLAQSRNPGARQYTLDVRGLAKSQAAVSGFVSRLEETRIFDQVRLLRTGREPFLTDSVVTFDLQCGLTDVPGGFEAPGRGVETTTASAPVSGAVGGGR